jgi:3-deoxy-D-manno-octulosonic-acid transferase
VASLGRSARRENARYLSEVCRTTISLFIRKSVIGRNRRGWRRYLLDRFGIFLGRHISLKPGPSIMVFINAGEILGITVFCATLRQLFPNHNLILAIDNMDAYLIGEQLQLGDLQIYAPWDFAWLGRRLKRRFAIDVAIFVSKIFHPVIGRVWRDADVTLGMVSGHFPDEKTALPVYLPVWRRLFALHAYEHLSFIAMQTEQDRTELLKHVNRTDLSVLGNVRADVSHAATTAPEKAAFYRTLHLHAREPIVIADATRDDEALIMDAYRIVAETRPNVRLIVVPRHFESSSSVAELARRKGFDGVRLSQLTGPAQVTIVDQPLRLAKLYSISTVVIFARTFQPRGGWTNILEPAHHGKPIVFGSHLKLWPEGLPALRARYPDVCVEPDARHVAAAVLHFLGDETAAGEVGEAFKRLTHAGEAIAHANARFVYQQWRHAKGLQPTASTRAS